jgi:hypothetical protein
MKQFARVLVVTLALAVASQASADEAAAGTIDYTPGNPGATKADISIEAKSIMMAWKTGVVSRGESAMTRRICLVAIRCAAASVSAAFVVASSPRSWALSTPGSSLAFGAAGAG